MEKAFRIAVGLLAVATFTVSVALPFIVNYKGGKTPIEMIGE